MGNLRSQIEPKAEASCARASAVLAAAASSLPSGGRVGGAGGSVWPERFCSLRPEFLQLPSTWQDRSAAGGAGLRAPESPAGAGIAETLHPLLPERCRFRCSIAPPGTSSQLATFSSPRNAAFKKRRRQGCLPWRQSLKRRAAGRQDEVAEAACHPQQGSTEVTLPCKAVLGT